MKPNPENRVRPASRLVKLAHRRLEHETYAALARSISLRRAAERLLRGARKKALSGPPAA